MIAFGPAHALEIDGAPGDSNSRKQERQKSDAEKTEDGDVSLHLNRISDGWVRGVDFGFDAQIIMTCWDAGDDYGVLLTALGPRTIAVVTVVIAHFAAEIPGLLGVLIDQRVIQIDPGVVDIGRSSDFHVRSPALEIENISHKRGLAFWFT